MPIEEVIKALENLGIFQYYLPFILTFSIFYGILTKAKFFGESPTAERINLLIAFSASFYILIFTPAGTTLANFFANFFGGILIIFITLLVFGGILWMGLKVTIGKEKVAAERKEKFIALFFGSMGAILLLAIFSWAGGFKIFGIEIPKFAAIDTTSTFVFSIIILTIIALWWVTKEEKKS